MNSGKIIGVQAVVCAVAAAAALAAGAARADEIQPGANSSHTPNFGSATVALTGRNYTKGCVRLYVNGQHDVQAGQPFNFGSVAANHRFTASVFPKGCGGAALKTVLFTTSKPKNWWSIH